MTYSFICLLSSISLAVLVAAVPPVVIKGDADKPNRVIIFLHGLGDRGASWESFFQPIVQEIPDLKVVLPSADPMPVSLNKGAVSPAWFNLHGLDRRAPEDVDGIRAAVGKLKKLVEVELAAGFTREQIIIGGFSQGGAVALHAMITEPALAAGTIGLSTWFPLRRGLKRALESAPPLPDSRLFIGHGLEDPMLPFEDMQRIVDYLRPFYPGSQEAFFVYFFPGGHTSSDEERNRLVTWLKEGGQKLATGEDNANGGEL